MYRMERAEFVENKYVSLWSLAAFQAGFVNAFGFLACGRYVSHITGFGTQIGVAAAEGKLLLAFELMGFPLSFILGAFFSGFWTSARLERCLRPRYDVITALLPITLAFLLLLGYHGIFGPFGEPLIQVRDFMLLFLLSFFCGMQNSCFATLTKGQIRTTHLTGIGTDIGSDFARLMFGKLQGLELELTKKMNFSRIMTFISFSAGSIVSVAFASRFEYWALGVPLLTSIVIFAAVHLISRILDERFSRMTNDQLLRMQEDLQPPVANH